MCSSSLGSNLVLVLLQDGFGKSLRRYCGLGSIDRPPLLVPCDEIGKQAFDLKQILTAACALN